MYSICISLSLTFLFRIIALKAWGIKKPQWSYLEFSLLDYSRKAKQWMETVVFTPNDVVEVFAAQAQEQIEST